MSYYYKLTEDKKAILCTFEEWANQLSEMIGRNTRHVKDEMINGYRISTAWLGFDHSCFGGLLFETMIFKGDDYTGLDYWERYSTWEEAEEGHKKAVEWLHENILKQEASHE